MTSDDGLPLIVERTMCWDASDTARIPKRPSTDRANRWYFAEGSQGFFDTFCCSRIRHDPGLGDRDVPARRRAPVVTRTYPFAPTSRFTVYTGADPAAGEQSFCMTSTSTSPVIAERAMYFGSARSLEGGHESAGVTAPSTNWFLAEGATGSFFDTFVLLGNPNPTPANVTLTFLPTTAAVVETRRFRPTDG